MKIDFNGEKINFYEKRPGIQEICDIIPKEYKNIIIEIGSLAGFSTKIFASNFTKVVSIDPYVAGYDNNDNNSLKTRLNAAQKYFKENILTLNNVEQHNLNSIDGAKLFEDNTVDVVFIDGCHTYDCVKKDITSWFPKIKKGGYLIGDDYNRPEVKKAADEIFGTDKYVIKHGKFYKIK